ncbi:hypothetical protein [Allokutzneria albata]|uniref:Uncharacterized protein n=1 Tax=Allokutzneria albata TaxID=211114 RepID=A0A1H0DTM1_ALLAB|nr:hypothetical protein [Allokutzneria albata]SDN73428.1 hypothetical protein SAMN04489726_7987 [Allokutzneria albata]
MSTQDPAAFETSTSALGSRTLIEQRMAAVDIDAVRRYVASNSTDAEDCRTLLDMLGLLPASASASSTRGEWVWRMHRDGRVRHLVDLTTGTALCGRAPSDGWYGADTAMQRARITTTAPHGVCMTRAADEGIKLPEIGAAA